MKAGIIATAVICVIVLLVFLALSWPVGSGGGEAPTVATPVATGG